MSTVALKWTDPTARVDGVPLAAADIASIDIFDSAATDPTVAIGNVPGAGTSFTTGVLSVGVHNFTAVVNDTTGHKSAPSNVFSATIAATLAAPAAITDLAGTVLP
jgi:hypothetical protein